MVEASTISYYAACNMEEVRALLGSGHLPPPPTRTVKGPHGDIEVVGEVPKYLPCAEGVKCGGCVNGRHCMYEDLATCSAKVSYCTGPLITAMVRAKWDEVRGRLCAWDRWVGGPPRVGRIEFTSPDGWDADIIDASNVYVCGLTSGGTIEDRS